MRNLAYKERPKYLNLLKIRLPITGVVSIFHRISGILLILSIPVCVFLLDRSLQGDQGFTHVSMLLDSVPVKLILILGLWAVAHHFFAGMRFLLFDIDIGVEKSSARRAAWFVIVLDIAALVGLVGWLL